MKSNFAHIILFLATFLTVCLPTFAQKTTIQNEIGIVLPPLEEVMAMAQRHSPQIRMQDALVHKNKNYIDVQRKQWLDGIGVDLQLGTGNQALLVQQATGRVDAFSNINNGYRAAVNIRISIFDVVGRKSWVKMAEYERQVSIEKKAVAEEELNTVVINRYYAIQTAQNLLKIKSEAKQATQLNRQMAEKEFNEGAIAVSELSRIMEIASKAASEYEVTKQYLNENLRVLENLTGKRFY
jgi:outer membrane protein TolC